MPVSLLRLQGFSGEVVEREGQQAKHEDADPGMMQRVMFAESPERPVASVLFGETLQQLEFAESPERPVASVLFGETLQQLDADAHQPHDAAGCNQPGGIQAARTDLRSSLRERRIATTLAILVGGVMRWMVDRALARSGTLR